MEPQSFIYESVPTFSSPWIFNFMSPLANYYNFYGRWAHYHLSPCNAGSFLKAKQISKLPHSSVKQQEAEAWVFPQDKKPGSFSSDDLPMAPTQVESIPISYLLGKTISFFCIIAHSANRSCYLYQHTICPHWF